jgi:hypothetical protein
MSKEFLLSNFDSTVFQETLEKTKQWCAENQLVVGLGEMAVGASVLAWGVHSTVISMGSDVVATELGNFNIESITGAATGASIGAIAAQIIGGIGVVGMGSGIAVPALLLMGGASAVLGMAGYSMGDVIHNIVSDSIDFSELAVNGSALLVGVALLVDGARRCIDDPKLLSTMSVLKEKTLSLTESTSKVIAKSLDELQGFIDELKTLPTNKVETSLLTGSSAIGAGVGASIGGVAAASSVTVLGSQALGGLAVSLGLVAAPLWPIIAGVAGGAGVGYATYKAIKYWGKDKEKMDSISDIL